MKTSRRSLLHAASAALAAQVASVPALQAQTAVVRVGPTRSLKTPSAASLVVKDGDTVEIDAGTYLGDVAYWGKNNLTIRAINGRVVLPANGRSSGGKAIWVIGGQNNYIEGIDFKDAAVKDLNGAGIRFENKNIKIVNCSFTNCQNGLLSGTSGAGSEVVFEACTFTRCGYSNGRAHGIYVAGLDRLTVRFCNFRDTVVGHHIKSRALKTVVEYCTIGDFSDPQSSYAIDACNGGELVLIGNVIQEGRLSSNYHTIAFCSEGQQASNTLILVNNTLISDRTSPGVFIKTIPTLTKFMMVNNVMVGFTQANAGVLTLNAPTKIVQSNITVAKTAFNNPNGFDYRFKAASAPNGQITQVADPTLVPKFQPWPIARTLPVTSITLPGALQTKA